MKFKIGDRARPQCQFEQGTGEVIDVYREDGTNFVKLKMDDGETRDLNEDFVNKVHRKKVEK